jgi:uncharacterized protein (DUF2236 family)
MEPYAPFALVPESVAWRVHASPVTLLGGIRALMIQALLPAAMAGVADHSSYQQDVWGRLNRTRDFVLAMVYGDVWSRPRPHPVSARSIATSKASTT